LEKAGGSGHWSSNISGLPEKNEMTGIWLAALLLGSAFAISIGQEVKGKVINVVIILVCMAVGAGAGFAMSLGRGNMGMVPGQAMPFAIMFGVLGAMVCVAKDTLQPKD
jgi:hypothetical protein